jgi:cytosine/adenosine deaminase-related metal-dependent hydrolase
MIQGHGFPITGRLAKLGARPSIGIDLESVLSGDLLSVARVALSVQRALDNAQARKDHGTIPATTTIPVREALRWITTEGARMLGREDQIGSLTPGKLADLVIIDASDLSLVPVHDPLSTVVMQTSLANIEAVMIGGVWKKRNGRLLVDGLEAKKEALAQSGQRLVRDIERQGHAA